MGYTHYWEVKEDLPDNEWEGFCEDVKKLIAEQTIKIGNGDGEGGEPFFGYNSIDFNGVGPGSHETFMFYRRKREFDFCKTARKPYDLIVATTLLLAQKHFGIKVDISSDGDEDDWKPAWNLFLKRFIMNDTELVMAKLGGVRRPWEDKE